MKNIDKDVLYTHTIGIKNFVSDAIARLTYDEDESYPFEHRFKHSMAGLKIALDGLNEMIEYLKKNEAKEDDKNSVIWVSCKGEEHAKDA